VTSGKAHRRQEVAIYIQRDIHIIYLLFFIFLTGCGADFQTASLFEKSGGKAPGSTDNDQAINEVSTKVKLTYYWTVTPDLADLSTQPVPIYNNNEQKIADIPVDLAEMLALEGSGVLPDGRLVNVVDGRDWPNTRFVVLDREVFPYGLDARGKALLPFKTIAVDATRIQVGSIVFIIQLKGVRMPDGTVHNGCVTAGDIGGGIKGAHIDFFSATYASYLTLNGNLKLSEVDIVVNSVRCK